MNGLLHSDHLKISEFTEKSESADGRFRQRDLVYGLYQAGQTAEVFPCQFCVCLGGQKGFAASDFATTLLYIFVYLCAD